MRHRPELRTYFRILTFLLIAFSLTACNLNASPEEDIALTDVPTTEAQPSPTEEATPQGPTPLPQPTNVAQIPTSVIPPPLIATSTPRPISILILSPIPGNIVASQVQVIGAASHPQFLQYQLEYGPDPNPNNLWFPISGVIQSPITSQGLLGIWNTTTIPDDVYQLRLRVFLRDGSELRTVTNGVRVQNAQPTPIPTNTPPIPRPVAAFTPDLTSGIAPLVVQFTNQSSGQITSYTWSFGDGGSSSEVSPSHKFNQPGVYNVTLSVVGPGGVSNVSRQINVQNAQAPIAAFTQDNTSGPAPLTVQFTDQSTGGPITDYEWNFGDGTVIRNNTGVAPTNAERNPAHTFTTVGTYNVILRVTGPGGSSTVTRQITVEIHRFRRRKPISRSRASRVVLLMSRQTRPCNSKLNPPAARSISMPGTLATGRRALMRTLCMPTPNQDNIPLH
ncbi:PKD domain-containing protein [bacterium]|nr:PKD domain-containing protein [bacterium]